MLNLFEVLQSLQLAAVGFIFCIPLMEQGMLFSRYDDLIESLPVWAYKILGGCEMCFTGQVALWSWLYLNSEEFNINVFLATYRLITYISFSILFVLIFKTLYTKWK